MKKIPASDAGKGIGCPLLQRIPGRDHLALPSRTAAPVFFAASRHAEK
ncbi:MAG: hypothetical protein HFH82_07185 [Lachnospiraceae bacterium]|nr:hypothetical protein [Lachnospiraceae bacterium]